MLNPGFGSGYSACLLAKEYGAMVIAADISARVLELARERNTPLIP